MANPTKPTVRIPTLPKPMRPGEAERMRRALSRPPRKNLLFPHLFEEGDLFDSDPFDLPWWYNDGFALSALALGVVGLAGLAKKRWGSQAEKPRRQGSRAGVAVSDLVNRAFRQIDAGKLKSAFDSLFKAEILHHLGDSNPEDETEIMTGWYELRHASPQVRGSRAVTGPGDRWTKKNAMEAYRSIQDAIVALRNEQQRNIPCTLFLLLDTPQGRQMKSVAIVFGHPSEIEPAVHTLLETANPAYSVLVGEGMGLDVATEQDAWRAIQQANPRRFVETVYARLDGPNVHLTQVAMILYGLVQIPWQGEDVTDVGMMIPGGGGAQA